MCGIAVLLARPGSPIREDLIAGFDRELAHRGPDAAGLARFGRDGAPRQADCEVALVHRRLSIIDLDARANQPMTSMDGRHVLIFNGEIYNYLELRAELERAGHVFRTESDSEVLLTAFAAWGEKALGRFTGMFAFIILDRDRRDLFFARDPFGIKPLFWALGADTFAAASEIGPLLKLSGIGRGADIQRVALYLSTGQTDAGEGTMFAGIRSLPAGCFARVALDKPAALVPSRYWRPRIEPRDRPLEQSAGELREAFLQSMRLHLRSDVPVGAALSGGIDSSAIVCCARAVGGQQISIQSFSFVAAGSEVDESPYIEVAAQACGATSARVVIQPDEIAADIDRLVKVQGEPFGSLSIYAQYRVMQLAAQSGIKVMLDGQGADELFAGYRPYFARRLSELLGRFDLAGAARFVAAMRRLPGADRVLLAQAFEPAVPDVLRTWLRQMVGRPLAPAWLDAEWFGARDVPLGAPALTARGHFLHDALLQSLSETVLPALLRYEDRNSMAFSIESRVPFLTTALADLAYSLPSGHLIDGQATSKAVLRAALRGIVPDAILDRRDKIGFATPDALWAKPLLPWFLRILQSDRARAMPWLKADVALKMLRGRVASEAGLGADLWRLVNVMRWIEAFDVEFA
jgi:asparagine synthase (glutamine-hydrolysing)